MVACPDLLYLCSTWDGFQPSALLIRQEGKVGDGCCYKIKRTFVDCIVFYVPSVLFLYLCLQHFGQLSLFLKCFINKVGFAWLNQAWPEKLTI